MIGDNEKDVCYVNFKDGTLRSLANDEVVYKNVKYPVFEFDVMFNYKLEHHKVSAIELENVLRYEDKLDGPVDNEFSYYMSPNQTVYDVVREFFGPDRVVYMEEHEMKKKEAKEEIKAEEAGGLIKKVQVCIKDGDDGFGTEYIMYDTMYMPKGGAPFCIYSVEMYIEDSWVTVFSSYSVFDAVRFWQREVEGRKDE